MGFKKLKFCRGVFFSPVSCCLLFPGIALYTDEQKKDETPMLVRLEYVFSFGGLSPG